MDAAALCTKEELGEIIQHHLVSLKFNVREVVQLTNNLKYCSTIIREWADEIRNNMNALLGGAENDNLA